MSTSYISDMFDRISPKYDALNHLLSFNIDKVWRRKTAKCIAKNYPLSILDLATGTADLAIALAKYNPEAHIIGVDLSEKMLEIGKEKVKRQNLESQIELLQGDAAQLPFPDQSFDAVSVAFGVRNFEDLEKGLSEISRVVKSSGQVAILEFSMPEQFPVKQAYKLYFKYVLPKIGYWISKDENAYTYLPDSVERFQKTIDFLQIIQSFGFEKATMKTFTFGIAALYSAIKT